MGSLSASDWAPLACETLIQITSQPQHDFELELINEILTWPHMSGTIIGTVPAAPCRLP
jgi:hypothetical protein